MPTKHRSWLVSPFGNNYGKNENFEHMFEEFYWVPIAALLPAFIIFIVLFFEVELTGLVSSLVKIEFNGLLKSFIYSVTFNKE
jgi:hypothetical protein